MARQSLARRDSALPANVLKDAVIQRLLEADRALQHATTIPQVKLVADVASAMEVLAKRQQLGAEIQAKAHEIETYAMAKLGSMTKDMPKADGGTHGGRPSKLGTRREPSLTAPATYADLGLNKKTISKAQQLADLPAHAITAIASGEKTFAKVRREHKAHAVAEKVSLPDAKFRVIVADPPWKYGNAIDEAMPGTTVAESHYPCLSIAELCALPVGDRCEDDAVLFLWVTSPLLFEAAPVIKAWGFTYKTSFVWDKVKHNVGFYNSVRHEFLLVCTRGSGVPDTPTLFDSVVSIERTAHSVKPQFFYDMISELYTHGKKLELFARAPRDGWAVYGNEL